MTDLYQHHPRTWQAFRFCYPVISRRSHGLSLGINVNPDKACNFACAYCSVDRTRRAPAAVDEPALLAELEHLLELVQSGALWAQAPFDRTPPELRRLNDVAFSGDGEPTSYAGFPRLLAAAGAALDRRGLGQVQIVVISNATLFHRAPVQAALVELARRPSAVWAKLDAGTEGWYRQVDRSDVPFQRILDNLALLGRLRPLVIQSLFCRLQGQAPDAAELDAWAARLAALQGGGVRIDRVQVYTTARKTAEEWATALTDAELEPIAARARALGLAAEVHGAG
jgi:wyosine [tRNA(Phe)-imidazoG37] synthetase (radical SAM superfamily)